MHDMRPLLLPTDFPSLERGRLDTLQVNLGYTCNQSCKHCHVNAGPRRKEQMSRQTIDEVLNFAGKYSISKLDLTGGAPELNPYFRYMVEQAHAAGMSIIDRCNLTILFEPGQEGLAEFLAQHGVEIVASLPCYSEENVDKQRGKGVFNNSIRGLQLLNELGYGSEGSGLVLNLMYNPGGAFLPPAQCTLEPDYKRILLEQYGIQFNRLLTLTNMPIARFGSSLVSKGNFGEYMQLLKDSHNDDNLQTVMCRNLISIDWQGYIYDCDFNQMLNIPSQFNGHPSMHISKLDSAALEHNAIRVAEHCYGCTAGAGSSCGGALS